MQRMSLFWHVPQCFMSPFFIQIVLLLFHPISFHQSPPICLSSISHYQVKTEHTFSTFQSRSSSTWSQRFIRARNNLFRHYFIFAPGNISSSCWSDTPRAVGAWFSCRALWVRIQPNFPSWCHFTLAARACKRKGKRKKHSSQKQN